MNPSLVSKKKYENLLVATLRLSLALVFIWFGVLKIFGYNPVFDLIDSVTPFLAYGVGLVFLGIFETLIGIGLALNKFREVTHLLLVLHLAGTFLTFLTGLDVVFSPHFPVLSLNGEFVVKNLVLAISGLLILVHESQHKGHK